MEKRLNIHVYKFLMSFLIFLNLCLPGLDSKVSESPNEIPVWILIGDLCCLYKNTSTDVYLLYLEHRFPLQMERNSDEALSMKAILEACLKELYYALKELVKKCK